MSTTCKNVLTVCGPAALVAEFVVAARGPAPLFKRDIKADAEWEAHCRAVAQIRDLSFHALVPLAADPAAIDYTRHGYMLQRKTWGTSNAYNTKLSRVAHAALPPGRELAEYRFDTATSPPVRWMLMLAWQDRWWRPTTGLARGTSSPSLGFALSWAQEDENRGRCLIEQRSVVRSVEERPTEAERRRWPDPDKDSDAYCALSDAWRDHYIRTHCRWLIELEWEAA